MPEFVSKMTATAFVMRIYSTETAFTEVTVTGQGMSYDTATGMIIGGEIDDISLSAYEKVGKKLSLVDVQKISGINLESNRLAEFIGDHFWNNAKLIVDKFDAFQHVHDQITYSYFSIAKNFTIATDYSDEVRGTKFNDMIEGMGGDDDLFGMAGNDGLYGGKGDDMLSGDAGNDLLYDLEGNNILSGGVGDDRLRAGAGSDVLAGGKGADVIYGGGGFDVVSGGAGADRFVFDMKDAGKLVISDFGANDFLVNLNAGSAEEAYKIFTEFAHQDGKNVVFDYGDMHLVLKKVKLAMLDVHHFADASTVADMGLF